VFWPPPPNPFPVRNWLPFWVWTLLTPPEVFQRWPFFFFLVCRLVWPPGRSTWPRSPFFFLFVSACQPKQQRAGAAVLPLCVPPHLPLPPPVPLVVCFRRFFLKTPLLVLFSCTSTLFPVLVLDHWPLSGGHGSEVTPPSSLFFIGVWCCTDGWAGRAAPPGKFPSFFFWSMFFLLAVVFGASPGFPWLHPPPPDFS